MASSDQKNNICVRSLNDISTPLLYTIISHHLKCEQYCLRFLGMFKSMKILSTLCEQHCPRLGDVQYR
jgi:hypothetical protein